jgi:hypothetical protein
MPNGTQVMKALQILSAVSKEDLSMVPEHDEIWIGHEISPETVGDAGTKALKKLGFDWDDSIPAWHGFVSA